MNSICSRTLHYTFVILLLGLRPPPLRVIIRNSSEPPSDDNALCIVRYANKVVSVIVSRGTWLFVIALHPDDDSRYVVMPGIHP